MLKCIYRSIFGTRKDPLEAIVRPNSYGVLKYWDTGKKQWAESSEIITRIEIRNNINITELPSAVESYHPEFACPCYNGCYEWKDYKKIRCKCTSATNRRRSRIRDRHMPMDYRERQATINMLEARYSEFGR